MFTINDCTDEQLKEVNLKDRYIILKEDFFKADFRDEKYQLVLAIGGFGCDPTNLGNAIFVKEIFENGEKYRVDRCDNVILGLASDSAIARYKEKYVQ